MKQVKFENRYVTPSKIVCVGRNYVEHIKELNNEIPQNMVIFCKVNSSIDEKLRFFTKDTRLEAEISFLVENNKLRGVGIGLDLTKADIQNYLKSKGLPWERAKAFDSSAVFSEFVELNGDIKSLELKLYINDNLQQHATYELMIYKPDEILKEITSFMSLEDGDIIMSGTPKGVTTYKLRDKIKAELFIDNKKIISKEWEVCCKNDISSFQNYVMLEQGTERAFTGEFWDNKKKGIYKCACCGEVLFDSDTKFDSGTGWPSFYNKKGKIKEYRDTSYGMERIEVRCGNCDAHLGHVFNDGPAPTFMRYCINSASLIFEEED